MHVPQQEQLNEAAEFLSRFESFSLALHRSLNLEEVTSAIVNDGRDLLDVDRLSVGVRAGKKCLLRAISGQDKVVQRSKTVKQLERLAAEVLETGQPLHYDGLNDESVGSETLAEYVTGSQVRTLLILRLTVSEKPLAEIHSAEKKSPEQSKVGCLIIEQFSTGELSPHQEQQSYLVAEHAAYALHNARDHQAVFLLPLLTRVGHLLRWFEGKKLWAAIAVLTAISAFIAACFCVPWEYRVSANGTLMPVIRHEIFAPWDAHVEDILVESGQSVEQGDQLIQLESEDLRSQLVAAETEVAEQRKRVSSLSLQLDQSRTAGDNQTYLQLQGELSKAEIELAGATTQLEVIQGRINDLLLVSPAKGIVTTFQLDELLADRPVRRGENILQIVDPSSEWRLELNVPEDRSGYLYRATQSSEEELNVDFVLATNVERHLTGKLQTLGTRVDAHEEIGGAIQTFVSLTPETLTSLPEKHVGAQVHAKIHCGQRSLGYVLFSDVIEFLARRFWL